MPLLSPGLLLERGRCRTRLHALRYRGQSFKRGVVHRPRSCRRCRFTLLVWLLPAHVATGFVRQAPNWWHPTAARFAAAAMPVAVAPAAVTLPRSAQPAQKDCRGVSGSGSGLRGWKASARSSVISTPIRRSGANGSSLRPISSV